MLETALLVLGIPDTDLAAMHKVVKPVNQRVDKYGSTPAIPKALSMAALRKQQLKFAGFSKFSKLAPDRDRDFTLFVFHVSSDALFSLGSGHAATLSNFCVLPPSYPTGAFRNSRGALRLNVFTSVEEFSFETRNSSAVSNRPLQASLDTTLLSHSFDGDYFCAGFFGVDSWCCFFCIRSRSSVVDCKSDRTYYNAKFRFSRN